jgi:hypothetical protein
MATKIEDQPAPVASTSTPAWELVIRYVNDNYEADPDGMRQATNKRELTKADELALGLFKDQIEALIDLREVL